MSTKKKAVLITCFEFYEKRILNAEKLLIDKGYEVTLLESDFRHLQKERRVDQRKNLRFVATRPYQKNLSTDRLHSHACFAKDAFSAAEQYKPDLIYVTIPPNTLVKQAARYKAAHPHVTLIFDVIDLWPESLPVHLIAKSLPGKIWRSYRDKHLSVADFVFTECQMFRNLLKKELPKNHSSVLYLSREVTPATIIPNLPEDCISLAYLGSINNIIDIPQIANLAKELKTYRPVTVHVIGNGENLEYFLSELRKAGAAVEYHGEVYDTKIKQTIFSHCHFGLNIVKSTVCIGLTMKSVDYFEAGLPIISSNLEDTTAFIKQYNAGIFCSPSLKETAEKIVAAINDDYMALRQNSRKLFESEFTMEQYRETFLKGLAIAEGES